MRRTIIAVLAVAIVATMVIGALTLSSPSANDKTDLSVDDGTGANQTSSVNNSTENVTATSPSSVSVGDEHFLLSASYEGAGDAAHCYETEKTYDLNIVATAKGSWNGRVVILAFATKVGEHIGPGCVILKNGGTAVDWNLTAYNGRNLEYCHTAVWTTNGSSQYDQQLSFCINTTAVGAYNMTFQAFDADSGKAISQPLNLATIQVPITGSLNIVRVGNGSFTTVNGTTYYEVVLNVTNGWNIPHSVDVLNLRLWVDQASMKVDQNMMTFSTQMLDPGQLTQFQAFFPTAATDATLKLTYDDNGNMIQVPLS